MFFFSLVELIILLEQLIDRCCYDSKVPDLLLIVDHNFNKESYSMSICTHRPIQNLNNLCSLWMSVFNIANIANYFNSWDIELWLKWSNHQTSYFKVKKHLVQLLEVLKHILLDPRDNLLLIVCCPQVLHQYIIHIDITIMWDIISECFLHNSNKFWYWVCPPLR